MCGNTFYAIWANAPVAAGIAAVDLTTGKATYATSTSSSLTIYHAIACDPKSTDAAQSVIGVATMPSGGAMVDTKLMRFDFSTGASTTIGAFPSGVDFDGYDNGFRFTKDGTQLYAAFPNQNFVPKVTGGTLYVMDTSSGAIVEGPKKFKGSGWGGVGMPYDIYPTGKDTFRGAFIGPHNNKIRLCDLDKSGSAVQVSNCVASPNLNTESVAAPLCDDGGIYATMGKENGQPVTSQPLYKIDVATGASTTVADLATVVQNAYSVNVACIPSSKATAQAATHPHLAQAWVAQSTGDGEPGATGTESYLYEDCPQGKTSDECVQAHIWNYGANNCIKYEINRGFGSKWSGQFYVKCEGGLDCCTMGEGNIPDIKKWDIGQAKGPLMHDDITHLGTRQTTALNNKPVTADTWQETMNLPFTKDTMTYTYYITKADNGDVITQRIDYAVTNDKKATGSILYGDFQVQHNLTAFRDVFQVPAACLKPNTLTCNNDKVAEWERKFFSAKAGAKPQAAKPATAFTVSETFLASSKKRAAAAATTHYEDPSAGPCQAGEEAVRIQGVQGGFCSPSCASGPCPTDTPAGTNASPECALETQGASKPSRCALICESSSKCPAKASCKMVQGAIGLCTYDS